MVAARTWIVDPVDGTTNFVRGIPFWCLSAGLAIDGVPAVGVIYDPCQDEMFSAHKRGSAMLNSDGSRAAAARSVIRYPQAGEKFYRYESSNLAFTRVTAAAYAS